jgi:hypothetical protein
MSSIFDRVKKLAVDPAERAARGFAGDHPLFAQGNAHTATDKGQSGTDTDITATDHHHIDLTGQVAVTRDRPRARNARNHLPAMPGQCREQ